MSRCFSDISAIKDSEHELAYLAHHDPLTGLPNRLLFSDRTEQALASAQLHKRGCALLLLDLDHFKNINDSLGHNVGDELLKGVAERFRGLFAPGVTLARLGGDEFAVLVEKLLAARPGSGVGPAHPRCLERAPAVR
nr:hypothetical protein GCM10020185_30340 [Pseudomonas brassicacearum subsp. brassicacearum]